MLKFKPIDPSRFQQHILNRPTTNKAKQKALESALSHTSNLHNMREEQESRMDSTVANIPSKVSIRTTRNL